ncbi:hypothetical protein A3863_14460 [Priestia endophytica]|uniref:hypothetical protein n=1 Tax=Priestia endophytica TaxID=135735 RepID=UPI000DCA3A9B|nr:hypothetical protein [Priestia endophytica]RAS88194.1 hypothetical protein A3863_14460 [Priestia endophytica]
MEQRYILERMVKITPCMDRTTELLKYDEYWHRFNGKVTESHDKTLCGEVFKRVQDENRDETYICASIEDFKDLSICPSCLKIWHEEAEREFEEHQLLGQFDIRLWKENKDFVKLFIENEGYDKLERVVNDFIYGYLVENDLLDKLKDKMSQKQN